MHPNFQLRLEYLPQSKDIANDIYHKLATGQTLTNAISPRLSCLTVIEDTIKQSPDQAYFTYVIQTITIFYQVFSFFNASLYDPISVNKMCQTLNTRLYGIPKWEPTGETGEEIAQAVKALKIMLE